MFFKYLYILYFLILVGYVESRPLSCSIVDEKFGSMLCCKVYAGSNSCRTLIPKNSFHFLKTWPLEIVKQANFLLERFHDKENNNNKEFSSQFVSPDAFRRDQIEEERNFLNTILPEGKKDCCCKKFREIIIPNEGYSYDKDHKYNIYQDLPDRAQVLMKVSCVNSTCVQNHKNYSCAESVTYVPLYVVDEEYPDYLREIPIEVNKDCMCKEECSKQEQHAPQDLGKELVKRFAEYKNISSHQIKGELADVHSKLKEKVFKTYNVSNNFKLFEDVVKKLNYRYNKAAKNAKWDYSNIEKYEENFFDAASLILIATKLLDFNISNSDYNSTMQLGSREEITRGQNISEGYGKFTNQILSLESSPKIIEASTTQVVSERSTVFDKSQNLVQNANESISILDSKTISEDYVNERELLFNQLLKNESRDSVHVYKTESTKSGSKLNVDDADELYENTTLNTFHTSKNYSIIEENSYEIKRSKWQTSILTTGVGNITDKDELQRTSNAQTFRNDYSLETITRKSLLPNNETEMVTRYEENIVSLPEDYMFLETLDSNSESSSVVTETESNIESLHNYPYNDDDEEITLETISTTPLWEEKSSLGKQELNSLVSTEFTRNTTDSSMKDSFETIHESSSMLNFELLTDDLKRDYNMEATVKSLEQKFPNKSLENYTDITTFLPDENVQEKHTGTLTTDKSQTMSIDTRNVSSFVNDTLHNLATNLKAESLVEEGIDSVSQTFQTTQVYDEESFESKTDQPNNAYSRSFFNDNSEILMKSTIENFQGFETIEFPDDDNLYEIKVYSTRSFDNDKPNTISTVRTGLVAELSSTNDQGVGSNVNSLGSDRDNYKLDNSSEREDSSEVNPFNIVFYKENDHLKTDIDTSVGVNISITDKDKAIFEDTFLEDSYEKDDKFISEDSLSFPVDSAVNDINGVSKYSTPMSLDSNTNIEVGSVSAEAYNTDKFFFDSTETDEPVTFPNLTLINSPSSSKNAFKSFQNSEKITESSILDKAILISAESMKNELDSSNLYDETYSTSSPTSVKSELMHPSLSEESGGKIHPILDVNINHTRNLIKNTEIKNVYKSITFPHSKPQNCDMFFKNCSLYCECCMNMDPSINGISIHIRETESGFRVKKQIGSIYDMSNSMSHFSETYRFLNSVLNKENKNEMKTLLGKAENLLLLENELLRNKLSFLKTMMKDNIQENFGKEFLEGKLYKNPIVKNIFSFVTEQIYKESKLSNVKETEQIYKESKLSNLKETEQNKIPNFLVNLLRNRNISPFGVYITETLFRNGFVNCKDHGITDLASVISISEILSTNIQHEVNKMLKAVEDLLKSSSLDRLIRHLYAFRSKEKVRLSYAEEDQIKITKEELEQSLLKHSNYFDKCKEETKYENFSSTVQNITNQSLASNESIESTSQLTFQNKSFEEFSSSLNDEDKGNIFSKEITPSPGNQHERDNRFNAEVHTNLTEKYLGQSLEQTSSQILQTNNYSFTYLPESTTEDEKSSFENSTLEDDNLSNDYFIYEERKLPDSDEYFTTQIVNSETSIDNYEQESLEIIEEVTLDMNSTPRIPEVTTNITNFIPLATFGGSEITDSPELDQPTLYPGKSEQVRNHSSFWAQTNETHTEREITNPFNFYAFSQSNEVDNISSTEEKATLQSNPSTSIFITAFETTDTDEETTLKNEKNTPSITTVKSTYTTTETANRNASASSTEIERIQIDSPPPQYRPIDIDISKVLKLIMKGFKS